MVEKTQIGAEQRISLSGESVKMLHCTDTNNNNSNNINNKSNNNNNSCIGGSHRTLPSRSTEKYGLRPQTIARRLQQLDRSRGGFPQRTSKSFKSKAPPLSKYRRKTANARERHRMKDINDAFETLRRILPDFCSRRTTTVTAAAAASAMTKITTLRLAVSYIRTLSHILQEEHPSDIFFDHFVSLEKQTLKDPQMVTPKGDNISQSQILHRTDLPPNTSSLPSSSSYSSSPSSSSFSASFSYTYSPANCSFDSTRSDISDILSDDSCCVFEDNQDAFADIPSLPEADPFALLLGPEGGGSDVLLLS